LTLEAALPVDRGETDRREIDARIGMTVFLASWGMVFLTLFFSYAVLRLRATVWPPLGARHLPLLLPGLNTVLIAGSSVVLRRGVLHLEAGRPSGLRFPLAGAMLLGAGFLALQIEIWLGLWRSGMRMQDGTYESLFYGLTTFHGLHVLAGLGALLWILPIARLERPATPRERIRVRSTAMFWHFVDLAWLATFAVVYVL
jgi:cytochrome c oxidase subunit III